MNIHLKSVIKVITIEYEMSLIPDVNHIHWNEYLMKINEFSDDKEEHV